MLKVQIELWPFGNEQTKRGILELEIVNNGTGDHDVGNYDIYPAMSVDDLRAGIRSGDVKPLFTLTNWARREHDAVELITIVLSAYDDYRQSTDAVTGATGMVYDAARKGFGPSA